MLNVTVLPHVSHSGHLSSEWAALFPAASHSYSCAVNSNSYPHHFLLHLAQVLFKLSVDPSILPRSRAYIIFAVAVWLAARILLGAKQSEKVGHINVQSVVCWIPVEIYISYGFLLSILCPRSALEWCCRCKCSSSKTPFILSTGLSWCWS